MFGPKKDPGSRIPIQTLIAADTKITGQLSFRGGLRIDGHVQGDVLAQSDDSLLVLSESGRITGRVQADHIVVDGRIEGPVECSRLIELHPKGQILGDVSYKGLEMHQGALVTGLLQPIDSAAAMKPSMEPGFSDE